MKSGLFTICMVILFSCNRAKNKETAEIKFDMESVKNHIINMNESYNERFMTNDSVFYAERYCENAEVYSPGMAAVKGRDSIISFFYQNGANKETKIELPAGNFYGTEDLVVEEGTYNFPDGKGGSFDKGKFIALWKKEDGNWKLFREIWNSDNPPPAAN